MKRFFKILLFTLPLFSFSQTIKLNIKYSKEVAVFEFLSNIASHAENPYKTIFEKSKYYNSYYINLVKSYDSLNLYFSLEYNDYPYAHKMPGMSIYWLKRNCILSNSLNDFQNRSMGLIPNSTLFRLVNIMKSFKPIYEKLIYQPNKILFNRNLIKLRKEVKTKKIAKYFTQTLNFYKSTWDKAVPLEICFYPMPKKGIMYAYAFINNAISQLPVSIKNYNDILGIISHEISHILYDEESSNFQNELKSWFHNNKSKNATYAYWILNEVLATSIGNGYITEKLCEDFPNGEWIAQKYIDTLSKSIYPELKRYMKEKQPMDKEFINNYITVYDKKFPTFINELENVYSYRYTIASNNKIQEIIANAYPYVSYEMDEDEITPIALEKMKKSHATKTIVISKDNDSQLKLIQVAFPDLNGWGFDAKASFVKKEFLNDKTHLFIINAQTNLEAEDMLKKFLETKVLDSQNHN